MEPSETVSSVVSAQPEQGLSLKGLVQVFYAPAALFEKLKVSPKVLLPYIVLIVLTLVHGWMIKDIMVDEMLRNPDIQNRIAGSGQPLTPQLRGIMAYTQMGQMVVALSLVPLIVAALALFWGNFVLAGKARFKQILSVAVYGELIFAVGQFLLLPLVLAKKSVFVSLSLAVLAPEKSFTSVLWAFLSKIDLFYIWELIVIGIGFSVIFAFPRNKGMWLSVLSVGLLTAIGIAFVALSKLIS